jgi:hypothetical protein
MEASRSGSSETPLSKMRMHYAVMRMQSTANAVFLFMQIGEGLMS